MEQSTVAAVATDVSIIEILLISIIAFIGAFIHEYISFIRKGKRITIYVWGNIFTTVLTSTILSVSINPFLVTINPRLILLPPLLMGLLGTELALRLSTISGSSSFIEYILGFFKIKKQNGTKSPTELDKENLDKKVDLEDEITNIQTQMEILMEEYKINKDDKKFVEIYKFVKFQSSLVKEKANKLNPIPLNTSLKLTEMIKIEVSLDKIYEDILLKK